MSNNAITLSSYSELSFDAMVSLYLYGAMETPDYYVERVRPYSERGVTVEMPAFDYMASGPGRYARASEAAFVDRFFNDTSAVMTAYNIQEGDTLTVAQLKAMEVGDADFKINVRHYTTDTSSSDFLFRAFIFGGSSYKLSDDTEFHFNNGQLEIRNLTIEPEIDNFDFSASNTPAQLVGDWVLKPSLDPYGLALDEAGNEREVFLEYTGASPVTQVYSAADFQSDSAAHMSEKDGWGAALVAFAGSALSGFVSDREAAGSIDYIDDAGRSITYLSPENDTVDFGVSMLEPTGKVIVGAFGNDTFNYAGGPLSITGVQHELHGGSGVDTLTFADYLSPLTFSISLGTPIDAAPETANEIAQIQLTDDGTTIDLFSFERIILTSSADRYITDGSNWENMSIELAFGGNPLEERDVLDLSSAGKGAEFDLTAGAQSAKIGDAGIKMSGVEEVIGTAHDDVFKHAKAGALITTGGGADKIGFSKGLGVTDASGEDRVVMHDGLLVSSLIRNGKSESPFSFSHGGAVKGAFNAVGELGIGDASSKQGVDEDFMYLMGANMDPFAATEDRTAGIRVAEIEMDSYLLVEKPKGISANNPDIWKLTAQLAKDIKHDAKVASSDPLVLDLDGDGIELTTVLSPGVGSEFDIDGDGFAEPTGWVGGDDGMLAVDTNGNGLIDDVDELFGKGSTTGYSELEAYDTNNDGVVDALDANFADLRIWQDANSDAITDAGELKTLTEWGVTSISLTYQDTTTEVAENTIARTGTFTFTDGSTGTMGDVEFRVNNFNTTYLGDTTVDPLLTQDMPNLKGYGTLTDLHVALTLEGPGGALAAAINANLASLAVFDMATMRANALPILQAWANSVPVPTTGGNTDIAVLMNASNGGRPTVSNFAILVTEDIPDGNGGMVSSTHYKLVGGGAIVDGNGDVIAAPTLADIVAQDTGDADLTWEALTGSEIDFMERFMGEDMPVDEMAGLNTLSVAGLSNLISQLHQQMELLSLRLAMQGPLEPYFAGIEYDPVDDVFRPTTDAQLVPMLETIFAATPSSTAQEWLEDWTPLLRAMLADYDRGEAHLLITRPFLFTNIVAAYENVPAAGIGLEQAAIALGMPAEMLNFGTGVREGTADVDMFYMGAGDDIARGGTDGDVYVFGRDFGSDRIEDFQQHGSSFDTIRFAHLNAADIEATRIGLDLRLTEIGTSNTILVKNQFGEIFPSLTGANLNPDEAIEEIVFADGSVWTPIDIAKAVSKPDATDQSIIGTDHVDFLDGGAGNDYLSGGNNLDFYFFDVGYGQDTIEDGRENVLIEATDVVMFGAGITRDNIQFNRAGNSLDLTISIDGTTDTLTILDQFDAFYSGPFGLQWFDRIESFQFDDGSSMDWSEVVDALLDDLSTDGDDIIYGVARDDRLDGGAGNDILSGGEESDTYIFGYGYGNDIIREGQEILISNGYDEVIFNAGVSLGDLTFSRTGNSDDLTIALAGSTDTLTIEKQFDVFYSGPFGKLKFDRVEGFKFADDPLTTLTWDMITEQVMAEAKTAGDDIIYGFDYEDVLDGGAGNDWLSGGSENDTYIFGVGYGQDTIFEGMENNILSGQDDKVVFNGTLLASDVTFSREAGNYDDLFIDINATADRLTIQDTFETATLANGVFDVESYHFSDGTILTLNDVQDIILGAATTAGNDTTIGFRRNDVIETSAGDDFLNGWHGNDTYKFGVGSGNDTIHEDNIFVIMNEADRVEFGSGITTADLVVTRDGNNAIISHINGQDSITIIDQHRSITVDQYMYAIESFVFVDGTVWSDGDLRAQTLVSTAQADTLIGYATADILDGGAGDDRLEGGSGGDTYAMGLGYGADTILEAPATGGFALAADKVVFGPGIVPTDLTVTQMLDDLIITIGSGGDSLTIEQFFASTANEVEEFHFDNGVIWFRSEIDAALANTSVPLPTPTVTGTIAGETLSGTNSDDIILGDQGDDIISGLAGNDVYIYRLGDGADTIKDLYYQGSLDELILGAGITPESVGLVRGLIDREDLTLTFSDGGSVLLDEQLYQVGTPGVDIIKFQDGTVWQATALRAMVLSASQTDLDDTVIGYGSDDVLDGGLGNDILEGLAGSDTYVYELGDGNDTIIEKFNHAGSDTLALGAGITLADLTFARGTADVDDLTLQIAGGGSVFLDEQFFQSGAPGIEAITFNDGSSLDLAGIRLATLNASFSSGNETSYGFANSADTFLGSAGNDILRGLSGNDTYHYNLGNGDDQIYEGGADGTADRVVFGSGITTTNITLDPGHAHLYDLTINFSDGGSLLLDLQRISAAAYGVEEVEFADGTIWSDTDIARFVTQIGTAANQTLTGTADVDRLVGKGGDDTLLGNVGNDIVDFGVGTDTATGGAGDDTFIFKVGYGSDTITDFEGGSGIGDVVEFQNSLAADYTALQAFMDDFGGLDTVIDFGGGDSLTLQGVTLADLHADDFRFVA